jgi:hypothetical protein
MFIFATSDKGGTGRSVTSTNLLYRAALRGEDVCYLDFDFGSPTAGAILRLGDVERGTKTGSGMHRYLLGIAGEPERVDVWREARRLAGRPPGAGQLVLFPGDEGGGEFTEEPDKGLVNRCADFFGELNGEFSICLVDLSAGRSVATDLALAATGLDHMRSIESRWLVFHRWTRQHLLAAAGLAYGAKGLVDHAVANKHDRETFSRSIRFVRTATIDPSEQGRLGGLSGHQVAWLQERNKELDALASSKQVGRAVRIATIPLDPVLQWQEQIISDEDVAQGVANRATLKAFNELAERIADKATWEQA